VDTLLAVARRPTHAALFTGIDESGFWLSPSLFPTDECSEMGSGLMGMEDNASFGENVYGQY
jgi:hypothetical protein